MTALRFLRLKALKAFNHKGREEIHQGRKENLALQ